MPRSPTWLDKVNFITFFLSNSCNFPWVVYFETALRPAGQLLVSFAWFGIFDLFRSFFRPKGVRSGRHGRKRRRGRDSAIPEPSEVFARVLPGQEEVSERRISDQGRNLWRFDAFIQRIVYHMFIVDTFLEWWTSWQSAIIRDDRTTCQGIGRALRENDVLVTSSGGWGTLLVHDLKYSQGPVSLGIGSVSVFTGAWAITIGAKARPFQADPLGVEMQLAIRNGNPPHEFLALSSRVTLFAGDEADLVATFYVQAPAFLNFAEFTQNGSPINFGGELREIAAFAMQMDS